MRGGVRGARKSSPNPYGSVHEPSAHDGQKEERHDLRPPRRPRAIGAAELRQHHGEEALDVVALVLGRDEP